MSRSAQLVGMPGNPHRAIASCVFQTWRRANHPSIANTASRLPAGRRDRNWSKKRIRFRVESVVDLETSSNQNKKPNDIWSEWQDLNLRPLRPERSALPG